MTGRQWADSESDWYNGSDVARRRYRADRRGLGQVRALWIDTFDGDDPWGSTVSHLFGIATVAYVRSGEIWEDFYPSPSLTPGNCVLSDFPDAEYWDELEDGTYTLDQLHDWYRVLLRYDAMCRHYEKDY